VLVDRDAVGCGASRRSAGLHFPRGSTERVRRMSSYSQDYYEKLRANQPTLPIYPVGMSVVSEAPERQLRESYLDTAGLTRRENVPGAAVRVPERAAVWRVDGGHYADVQGLAQDFARELRSRVSFREGVRVAAIEPIATGVVLYLSSGDTLTVGQVVLAPGPWLAAPAWRSLVAPLGARVKKVVALHIEQCPTVEDQAIVFHDEDAFLVPFAHRGHWLFSYTCQEWDVDPDVVGAGLYPHNVAEARDCLHRFAPTLAARCTSGRVFCDAYSPTGNPIVRTLDPAGRMVFAGAANGSGYRLAPAMAAEATDLLDLPAEPRSAP
jgi:glycine/D-amino acid oxidase-like deaminating enzyme